jgi:ABC-2 type transport system permease protein
MASQMSTIERSEPIATSTPIAIWLRLLRHHLRLLAPTGAIWIILLVASAAFVVGFWAESFPTEQDRISLAQSIEGNPAFEAMFGRAIGLETLEGFTMWRAGGPLFPAIVVWGLLAATRLTRGDEDKGHDELLLGGVISRQSLLVSALAALTVLVAIYVLLTAVVLLAVSEITVAGAWRYALATAAGFAFFGALGALLVQITPSRSVAIRIGLFLIGAALGVRILAVLEAMPSWLPWTTPFGWFAEVGPPNEGSNLPFLFFVLGTIVFSLAAVALSRRRELHGSRLLEERETADPRGSYQSLWKHESRQDLPAFVGFASVGLFLAIIYGMVANDFVTFVEDFPGFADVLREFGLVDPTDPAAFIGLVMTIMVLVVTLFAAGRVVSLRDEEASGRIAVLLALPLRRDRWLVVNSIVALVGMVIISLLIGFGAMIGTSITGTMLEPVDALRAGLNLIPIAVLFFGLGILIFGLYPPLTGPLLYIAMISGFLVVMMDAFMDIPRWIIALAPFEYLALVPGEAANILASAVFVALGLVSGVIGVLAFLRRDIVMD